jgi:hypothetical protein
MKRKLKAEIYNNKKFQSMEKNSSAEREFDESLSKLALLAKSKVKIADFTNGDKLNMIDLLVNDERCLMAIYEVLFTNRNSNINSSAKKA